LCEKEEFMFVSGKRTKLASQTFLAGSNSFSNQGISLSLKGKSV
jgi:hypothetical protein